jgi:hypothetical protein
VLLDKAKIHHLGQVFQEVGSLGQNLLIRENRRKRNRWLCPFWSWPPLNIIYQILQ